ncbi:threonine-phosphate decarboxylase, partial [Pseudomonas sp. TNT11]|nr:threonine-phosphate decarboxylase [Pseudomonas emilianonis]
DGCAARAQDPGVGRWRCVSITRAVADDQRGQLRVVDKGADLLEHQGFQPQGGCALFQWLITPHAERLHAFMAQRGILLRLFVHDSSLRFGLPDTDADWLRLEQALIAYKDAT